MRLYLTRAPRSTPATKCRRALADRCYAVVMFVSRSYGVARDASIGVIRFGVIITEPPMHSDWTVMVTGRLDDALHALNR